jgi:hypothetical protein
MVAVSFIGGGNRNTQKTTDMSQVTDKLFHINVSSTPRLSGVRTHNFRGNGH